MKRDFEDQLEAAYWSFDDIIKNHKGISHRDAFKQACRQHLRNRTPAEIDAKLQAGGWREFPGLYVVNQWEAKGGRWQIIRETYEHREINGCLLLNVGERPLWCPGPWRPVNPETWDYDPRGWEEDTNPQ